MNTTTSVIGAALSLVVLGCDAPEPEPGVPPLDEFSILPVGPSDDGCETECEPVILGACDLFNLAELVVFVEVTDVEWGPSECSERTYSGRHQITENRVLHVAYGDYDGSTISAVSISEIGGPQGPLEVGETGIVGLRRYDGTWFQTPMGRVKIEPGESEDDVSAQDIPDDESQVIFDLSTSVAGFTDEIQQVFGDFTSACGRERMWLSDGELRDKIYDKNCSPEGASSSDEAPADDPTDED